MVTNAVTTFTFTHVWIYTAEGQPIPDGFLTVRDGIIAALGDMADYHPDRLPQNGVVTDLRGRRLYPGFIDAHTHVGMWDDGLGFEGDDGNEIGEPVTAALRAIDAVNGFDRCFEEAHNAGVTTVVTGPGSANPIGGMMAAVKTTGGRVDHMILKFPVSMKMALGENPKTVYHQRDETPVTRMATARIIREALIKAQRYAKALDEAEEESDKPDYDADCEALIPVIRGELPVHFHAHRRDDIFTAVRIAEEFGLDYIIVHGTEGHLCAEELAACGAKVFSGPLLSDRSKPELSNLSPAAAGILDRAGIPTALVTDHPVIPIQYLPVCAGLMVREGMDYDSALRGITIRPAQLLGIDDRVGSLRVGKDADFSVFDADPLTLAAKPLAVYIDGREVYHDARF
ncbi:MAG: amidohydrolase [Clostridia bacterium]|nr:amidohydrolase [Clostridia bacterium]